MAERSSAPALAKNIKKIFLHGVLTRNGSLDIFWARGGAPSPHPRDSPAATRFLSIPIQRGSLMTSLSLFRPVPGIRIWAPPLAGALIEEIWDRDRYFSHARIEPGDVVVDIGANIGAFTILAASRGARVYAFEPNPEAFSILERNIRENGFSDRVDARELAIAGHAGELEISIPDSEKIYSLGSATTCAPGREQLAAVPEVRLRSFLVRAQTLSSVASEIPGTFPAIRFLKIDCEGAEWEILRSLEAGGTGVSTHIAMETHAGYAEKDLLALLGHLGYAITGYTKRGSRFSTGYAYATLRDQQPRPIPVEGVVAILEGPTVGTEGGEFRLDASGSFALPHPGPDPEIEFAWTLEDRPVGNGAILALSGLRPGAHDLRLRVRKGAQEDSESRRLFILEKGYAERGADGFALSQGVKTPFRLRGRVPFRIPVDLLPGTWDISGVTIAVERNLAPGSDTPVLELYCNGSSVELKRHYSEVNVDFPARDVEPRFSLNCQGEEEVRISWWPYHKEMRRDDSANEGGRDLPPAGQPELARFSGSRPFRIAGSSIPKEWTPKAFKIGIAAVPDKGKNKKLAGTLEHGGTSHAIEGWYREIELPGGYSPEGLEFTVTFPEESSLKLVWWAE